MGEPELKQWELWVGKLCQKKMNANARINHIFNVCQKSLRFYVFHV